MKTDRSIIMKLQTPSFKTWSDYELLLKLWSKKENGNTLMEYQILKKKTALPVHYAGWQNIHKKSSKAHNSVLSN